ncbi:MAG: phospholipase D-like domain-containing protein [Candidatus Xenobia bacterium]
MSAISDLFGKIGHVFHHATPQTAAPAPEPVLDPEVSPADMMDPQPPPLAAAARRPARPPKPGSEETSNPQIGRPQTAPRLTAGPRKSPQFLPTEADYFAAARSMLQNAKPGDIVCLQMYEFENGQTNPMKDHLPNSQAFQDQQALLPLLAEAANRGVNVHIILDASKNRETRAIGNAPITQYLQQHAGKSGHLTLDYYPPETVTIDHAKELLHLTPNPDGSYAVESALVGGSNWGNHTPFNDDGGGLFYGSDAVGAASVFFRDQAFCRGDRTSPALPDQENNAPVQWAVTSPTEEGGGSESILQAKERLTQQAVGVYVNQFCLNQHGLVAEIAAKGLNAHVRLDPNEYFINKNAYWDIKHAGGEVMWANTDEHPDTNPGQKNHEKIDVYTDASGQAFAATFSSANDTVSGLNTTYEGVDHQTGRKEEKKTNHELDAVVYRVTDGDYSTAPFLDAMLAKCKDDLAHHSLEKPPEHLSGTGVGQF